EGTAWLRKQVSGVAGLLSASTQTSAQSPYCCITCGAGPCGAAGAPPVAAVAVAGGAPLASAVSAAVMPASEIGTVTGPLSFSLTPRTIFEPFLIAATKSGDIGITGVSQACGLQSPIVPCRRGLVPMARSNPASLSAVGAKAKRNASSLSPLSVVA